ncbi:Ferredoxin fas2 [Pseudomonas sp. 37 R 15]|uniref:transketolase n=1 Tax=Pseudomonas sp. 37 R 15 TaxID=1844104 RepID=UPI0008125C5D|nr:transketolase [Pseudomonas sp. 37 R 15]CRM79506.1 Ferredoxin fas2 [Pseudomonas sp. 37 R 15]
MMALDERSLHLRRLIAQTLICADMGHVGPSLSLVEILRVLYDSVLSFDCARPDWPDRDRLILSKGHGCAALYAILADKEFFPLAELSTFCSQESRLGGHPEKLKIPGVEASAGSLGHGLSIGVGMAVAARLRRQTYRTFVITGDGELNEGSIWEAALHASKHRLANLTVIVDCNDLQCFGRTDQVLDMAPLAEKWRSFGFDSLTIDGHDLAALKDAFARPPSPSGSPLAVICKTVKGKGLPIAEGNPQWHHKVKFSQEDVLMIKHAFQGDLYEKSVL